MQKLLRIDIDKLNLEIKYLELSVICSERFLNYLNLAINSDYYIDFYCNKNFSSDFDKKDIYEEFKRFFFDFLKKKDVDIKYIRVFVKSQEIEMTSQINLNYQKTFDPESFMIFFFSKSIFPEISLVTSFYNEADNIQRFWNQVSKLENLLNIKEFVFINNGSNDKTLDYLENLKANDSRIIIKSNISPSTYAKGFTSAISFSNSEYTLITHSDCQFGLDTSIKSWIEQLFYINYLPRKKNIIALSKRLNRSKFSNLITYVNSSLSKYFIFGGEYLDFNSQPKILPTKYIKSYMLTKRYSEIVKSEGYVFDLSLISHIYKKFVLNKKEAEMFPLIPIITLPRLTGSSSWQRNPASYINNILLFLKSILREIFI